tara:strand:+ start:315 stop:893 length:579 start_codon:yes stop_codon:yes gene_type:complete
MKTRLNMPGFKLKHMSALPVKKYGEAEEPKINRNFPRQENRIPEGEGRYNAALNSNHLDLADTVFKAGVVGSSGGKVDPFDVDYSGVEPVDLGTIKLSDEGRAAKGFRDEFGNYMGREFKGNDERLGRITAEQNYKEAMGELREKYFDLERDKLRLIPTDDAEMQDENFKSKLKSYQLFNPEMFADQKPKDK